MPAAIKVENLQFAYDGVMALDDINLEIETGDFVGVVGPNGSGKTTLIKTVCHSLKSRHGNIRISGHSLDDMSHQQIAKEVAVVPQELTAAFPFTVWEMVSMGRHPYMGRFSSLNEKDTAIVNQVLEKTGLTALKKRFYAQLSGGEKQKVLIAQTLAQEAGILLLDEPTSHLDISHQLEIMNLVADLNKRRRQTVVAVVHDLNLAANFCKKLILMRQGRIIKYGSTAAVLTKENLAELFQTDVIVETHPVTGKINVTYLI